MKGLSKPERGQLKPGEPPSRVLDRESQCPKEGKLALQYPHSASGLLSTRFPRPSKLVLSNKTERLKTEMRNTEWDGTEVENGAQPPKQALVPLSLQIECLPFVKQ